ncbi:hypothetical protein D3C73_532000 [compost metagenome]
MHFDDVGSAGRLDADHGTHGVHLHVWMSVNLTGYRRIYNRGLAQVTAVWRAAILSVDHHRLGFEEGFQPVQAILPANT